jgi:hypothetical protein
VYLKRPHARREIGPSSPGHHGPGLDAPSLVENGSNWTPSFTPSEVSGAGRAEARPRLTSVPTHKKIEAECP